MDLAVQERAHLRRDILVLARGVEIRGRAVRVHEHEPGAGERDVAGDLRVGREAGHVVHDVGAAVERALAFISRLLRS